MGACPVSDVTGLRGHPVTQVECTSGAFLLGCACSETEAGPTVTHSGAQLWQHDNPKSLLVPALTVPVWPAQVPCMHMEVASRAKGHGCPCTKRCTPDRLQSTQGSCRPTADVNAKPAKRPELSAIHEKMRHQRECLQMVSAAAQQLPEEVYRPEGKRAPKAPEEQGREDRRNKRRAHKVADKKRTAQKQVRGSCAVHGTLVHSLSLAMLPYTRPPWCCSGPASKGLLFSPCSPS